jgi:hypothetical protein
MFHRGNSQQFFTGVLPCLLGFLAMGGLLLSAQRVAAQTPNCIQDVWQAHGNKQNLTCTANDVQISNVTNIDISAGGQCKIVNGEKVCTCFQGQNVTFAADFEMVLTAQDRYDIGFYIATDGDTTTTGALTGQCASTNVTSANSTTFFNLDPSPDLCGDITGPAGTVYNPQIVRFTLTMPCVPDANGKLALPYCTTWRQPGSNQVCIGTGTSPATNDVYPGSPSKCFCGIREIDIFTETASIEVTKENISGNVLETGGSVTYSVSVINLAQVSSVTLDSLTDDIYGDITKKTPDNIKITDTTCALATIPAGNVPGNPYTCTFTAIAGPGDTGQVVTDTVTACGHDQFGHSNLCDDDPANFTYTDVQEPPTLVKTAIASSNVSFSVDVTYTVVVNNTSPTPPGDLLTLNSLCDDRFGDLTGNANPSCGSGPFGTIVSTTCGKAGVGLPGTLPADIPPGSNYTCQFVGRVTSSPHVNTSTASATDDDGVTYTPYNEATVNVTVNVTFP